MSFRFNRLLFFFLVAVGFSGPFSVMASTYCPSKIARLEGDPLGPVTSEILTNVYQELGCDVEFLIRPGRRGILDFNNGIVDGELFRLMLVEGHYTTEFVRSKTPIIELKNALWLHADLSESSEKKSIGYVLGLKWHEIVVADLNDKSDLSFVHFGNEADMLESYSNGILDGFLSEKQTVALLIKKGALLEAPRLVKTFGGLSLYHYLHADFARFMGDFSDYIVKHDPFSALE